MRMQLTIRAEKLNNVAGPLRGTSDPYAVVVAGPSSSSSSSQLTTLGRTETIRNSLSPDFCTTLFVDADPNVIMPFRVTLYDDNHDRTDKLMCDAHFDDLYSVYEATGDSEAQLPKHTQAVDVPQHGGRIYVHLELSQKGPALGHFGLQLRGLDLKNVETGVLGLGRSDPFFEVARKNADPDNGIVHWNPIHRSKHIQDNLNPFWDEVTWFTVEELCYGDIQWPLKLTVKDWQANGKHRIIGQVQTTIRELQHRKAKNNGDRENALVITKEGKEKKKGLLVVIEADLKLS